MKASIILALVGLVSNITEAIELTAAVDHDFRLFASTDCSGPDYIEVENAYWYSGPASEQYFAGVELPG